MFRIASIFNKMFSILFHSLFTRMQRVKSYSIILILQLFKKPDMEDMEVVDTVVVDTEDILMAEVLHKS